MISLNQPPNNRALKCRQTLSTLLTQQIDRNQQLQAQNIILEEQQRKLIKLLQRKMEQLQQLQVKPERNNDSTLEMTQLSHNNEHFGDKQEKIWKNKLAMLDRTLKQKDEQMVRLRDYYTTIIQKIDHQHHQSKNAKDSPLNTLKQQVKKMKVENNSLHEIILRGNEKVRELSQGIMEREQDNGELGVEKKVLEERCGRLKKEVLEGEKHFEDIKGKMKLEYQDKLMKMKQTNEQMISKMHHQSQKNLQSLQSHHYQALCLCTKQHQQMLNNLIIHSQQQKQTLRHQYIKNARQCIMQQLQKQGSMSKGRIGQLEERIREYQMVVGESSGKMEEQCQVILGLEEEGSIIKGHFQRVEKESKRVKEQLLQKNIQVQNLQLKFASEKENSQNYKEKLQQMDKKNQQKDEKYTKQLSDFKKSQTIIKKLTTDLNDIKTVFSILQQDHKTTLIEVESKSDQIDRLNTKIIKQNERKQKIVTQYKKSIKQLQDNLFKAQSATYQMKHQRSQQEQLHKRKFKQITQFIQLMQQQNARLLKENKKVKEELKKIDQLISNNLKEYEHKYEEVKSQNKRVGQNNKNLGLEKQNYRKLYENGTHQMGKLKEKNQKYEQKIQKLNNLLHNYQTQIQFLKEEIATHELNSIQKAQIQKCKKDNIQLKAKVTHYGESITKLKKQNSELAKDTISLHEQNSRLKQYRQKLQAKMSNIKAQKNKYQVKIKQLQTQLEDRCQKIQNQMPFINTLIQQKKILETQLKKCLNDNKRKDHLLQVAKRTKAQQLIALQKQLTQSKKAIHFLSPQLKQSTQTIQRLTREKVSTLRQYTNKQEHVHRVDKENKALKGELKKMQGICDDYQKQLESMYKILEQHEQSR